MVLLSSIGSLLLALISARIPPKEHKEKIGVKIAENLSKTYFKSGIFFGLDGECRQKNIFEHDSQSDERY
jgi:hypothetical protein